MVPNLQCNSSNLNHKSYEIFNSFNFYFPRCRIFSFQQNHLKVNLTKNFQTMRNLTQVSQTLETTHNQTKDIVIYQVTLAKVAQLWQTGLRKILIMISIRDKNQMVRTVLPTKKRPILEKSKIFSMQSRRKNF